MRTLLSLALALFVFGLLTWLALGEAAAVQAPVPDRPYTPSVAPASDEAARAVKGIRVPAGVEANVFAAEPLLANPVCFCFDEKGRCYVAETFRLHHGVTDDRGHMNWLDEDLASRTVADRVAMYKRHAKDRFADTYEREHDRVRLLEDTNGDGVADKATVFADGFHHAAEGIGAGLLARKGNVWYTCIPDLWLLRDTRGSGQANERKSLQTGYGVRVSFLGHDLHGLRLGPDGKLYFSIGDRGLNVRTADGKHIENVEAGAVLRCEPDGSNLELVATGLRNPQELAFDQYGNLFTVDNNSDSGDAARLVYVVEGGDSGWRMGYQYDTAMGVRGPFNQEKLWHLPHEGQPAYLVPPLAHVCSGPSGFTHDPGVSGLPDRYKDHFFVCDFRGDAGSSGVRSFAVKPKGAAFEMVDQHEFIWSLLATDCEFGPDGAFYVSDWVHGWDLTGKGRIYRFSDPAKLKREAVRDVKKLLADGFDRRPVTELVGLLSHADQRIRQEAQFALADRAGGDKASVAAKVGDEASIIPTLTRVAQEDRNQLARLHALWALGQIHRHTSNREALGVVASLLRDADPELRAQAARSAGDSELALGDDLVPLLHDAFPRVRFFAALALGKLHPAGALTPILQMLRDNADRDAYLRHAGVMALVGLAGDKPQRLQEAAQDPQPAVRLAVLLAWRHAASPAVASFLNDADPRLVVEAARAIYDLPIPEALPQLAALVEKPNLSAPLLWRVLNANFRLGKPENAAAIAAFAARSDAPEKLRVEALQEIEDWTKPAGRDRVLGQWRPLAPRAESAAADAVRPALKAVLNGPDPVRKEATRLAGKLRLQEAGPALLDLLGDRKRSAAIRIEALKALDALNNEHLGAAIQKALADDNPACRVEALRLLAKTDPRHALPVVVKRLEQGAPVEQQGALALLGEWKGPEADPILCAWLDRLQAGQAPAEIQLDVLLAARQREAANVKARVASYEAARAGNDPLGAYRETLKGGNAEAGRKIFFSKQEAQCLKCHKVNGEGGDVGPDLKGIGTRQPREYLLESIVDPNKQIAKGYETVVLTTKKGLTHIGIIKSEDAREVKLITAEGKLESVAKDDIDERQTGKSAMPEDLVKQLSRTELRDLVEYLANLK